MPAARACVSLTRGAETALAGRVDAKFRRSFAGGNAELTPSMLNLDVAERDSEGIGSVGGFGDLGHREQGANHDLHLTLVGVTVARHGSFDFARGVAVHGKIVLGGGEQDDTADFGEAQGGADIERAEDGFDGEDCGREFGDQRTQALVNILQSRRPAIPCGVWRRRGRRRSGAWCSGGRRFRSRRSQWGRRRRGQHPKPVRGGLVFLRAVSSRL